MRILKYIFLTHLGADGCPADLKKNEIRVTMMEDSIFRQTIGRRWALGDVPFWMKYDPFTSPPNHIYFYIRTATNEHFGSYNGLVGKPKVGFNDRTHGPKTAWINLENQIFFVKNFQKYEFDKPHTDFGQYGRVYVTLPYGPIYSAMLEVNPKPEESYINEKSRYAAETSNVKRRVLNHKNNVQY